MRSYFVTVRSHEVAKSIDPGAELVRTLPPGKVYRTYCCRPSEEVGGLPEAYIYKVRVNYRRDAEKAPGVVRCRAKEPKRYRTVVLIECC